MLIWIWEFLVLVQKVATSSSQELPLLPLHRLLLGGVSLQVSLFQPVQPFQSIVPAVRGKCS